MAALRSRCGPLRLGEGKKKKERKKERRNYRMKIYMACPIT